MTQHLENLSGPGKALKAAAPDANDNLGEDEGLLEVDERLVADLTTATERVAKALKA